MGLEGQLPGTLDPRLLTSSWRGGRWRKLPGPLLALTTPRPEETPDNDDLPPDGSGSCEWHTPTSLHGPGPIVDVALTRNSKTRRVLSPAIVMLHASELSRVSAEREPLPRFLGRHRTDCTGTSMSSGVSDHMNSWLERRTSASDEIMDNLCSLRLNHCLEPSSRICKLKYSTLNADLGVFQDACSCTLLAALGTSNGLRIFMGAGEGIALASSFSRRPISSMSIHWCIFMSAMRIRSDVCVFRHFLMRSLACDDMLGISS